MFNSRINRLISQCFEERVMRVHTNAQGPGLGVSLQRKHAVSWVSEQVRYCVFLSKDTEGK